MLVLVFAIAAFVNGYLDHRPPTVWCQLLHSRRMEWQVSGLVSEIQFIQIVVVTKCHIANYPKTQYLRIIATYAQESVGSAQLAPPRAAHLCVPVCSMRLSSALDKWASLGVCSREGSTEDGRTPGSPPHDQAWKWHPYVSVYILLAKTSQIQSSSSKDREIPPTPNEAKTKVEMLGEWGIGANDQSIIITI